jgi:signal recognition particle receptor subunit beta
MVQFNFSERTIKAKVVYYGPPQSGKTTNLEQIHRLTDPDGTNRLISLNTAQDRTLFFDLLPFSLGTVSGYDFKIQLYTVPGQVQYNATRRVVLAGADAVVFVADSQKALARDNVTAFENMKVNLLANRLVPEKVPLVLQYNKQDLEGLQPREELDRGLNFWGRKAFPAVAARGEGVLDTFVAVVQDMLGAIAVKYNLKEKGLDPEAVPEIVAEAFAALLRRSPLSPGPVKPIPPEAAKSHARVVISQLSGAEPAYPGQVGPEVSPVSEELLHRAIRSNVELAEALGQLVRDVNSSLGAIQKQADALASGAPTGPAATAIRAELERVRKALVQLGPDPQPAASRAPAPPQHPPTPPRSFSPASAPPLSPATISLSRASIPAAAPQTIPPPLSQEAAAARPSSAAAAAPPAGAASPRPAAAVLTGSRLVSVRAVPAPPRPGSPSASAPGVPRATIAAAASAPAPASAATLDALLVEVVRGARTVLAARPVGVESRIPRGTALPRGSADVLRAALVGVLLAAAATARPSTVVSARAEKKPVLLRARDGSEVKRDFMMIALAQQGGPSEAEQRTVLGGQAQGPLADALRNARELGGFLRFAPLPQGGVETRLFLPA